MSPSTKVQIYNQTYSLQGDLDQAYLQELAGFVDAKMHAIANMTSTVDTQRVAVLDAGRARAETVGVKHGLAMASTANQRRPTNLVMLRSGAFPRRHLNVETSQDVWLRSGEVHATRFSG